MVGVAIVFSVLPTYFQEVDGNEFKPFRFVRDLSTMMVWTRGLSNKWDTYEALEVVFQFVSSRYVPESNHVCVGHGRPGPDMRNTW